jgi:hypothetical protein
MVQEVMPQEGEPVLTMEVLPNGYINQLSLKLVELENTKVSNQKLLERKN